MLGAKLWEFETGEWVDSSPANGSDGTIYVGSFDKKLCAIKTDSKGLAKKPMAHARPECRTHGSGDEKVMKPTFGTSHPC